MTDVQDISIILGIWGPEVKSKFMRYMLEDCYYSNVCGYCFKQKNPSDIEHWISCEKCKLISYCCIVHMDHHKTKHEQFDLILSQMLADTTPRVKYYYELLNLEPIPIRRYTLIYNFLKRLSARLAFRRMRELYKSEDSMLKYPPHCEACPDAYPDRMRKCHACPANFCKNHIDDAVVKSIHNDYCSAYLQSFIMEGYKIAFAEVNFSSPLMKLIHSQERKSPFPESMTRFLETQIDFHKLFEGLKYSNKYKKSIDFDIDRNIYDLRAYTSLYLTKPLTLIYAIRALRINLPEETTIHILGSSDEEILGLRQWEILTHWLPGLKKLTIVFVGTLMTTFPMFLKQKKNMIEICSFCASRGTELCFQFYPSLYKEFRMNIQHFNEPNLVVVYNSGFNVYDEWNESLLFLKEIECPLIFTSYYKDDAVLDHEKIRNLLGEETEYHMFTKNPYRCLVPLRFYSNCTPLVYKNDFITIYTDLNPAMD